MLIQIIKNILWKFGYKLNKVNKNKLLHDNYLKAVESMIGKNPILFDVGANYGQTINKFREIYPESVIHSFEPSKHCFNELNKKYYKTAGVVLVNSGIGSTKGRLEFNERSWSPLNSFLDARLSSSTVIDRYVVDVISIDDYCTENNINFINVLKTDTEGYDLHVLKGAEKMMERNLIQFIYSEVFFYENYIGQSSFGDIYNLLINKGFVLVRFYSIEYTHQGFASRTDALFYNPNYKYS